MSNILETLAVKLVLDAADFADGISKSESKMAAFGHKLTSIGQGMTLGVTTPLVGIGVAAINAASDLGESLNKVNVVFGDSAGKISDWAAGSAKAFGQSRQQALEAAGTFGNLFTAMDIGVEQSTEMSTKLVELASDLASFNNIDPAEALEKLRAGLVGETEPLRTLGVNLSAATIEAKALQMGLVETSVDMVKAQGATLALEQSQAKAANALAKHGEGSLQYRTAVNQVEKAEQALQKAMAGKSEELSAADKAMAAYAIILEQTKTAQGDFARTSDGLANSTRTVKAQFADAAAALGEHLLPMATQAMQILSGLLERFNNLSPSTQEMIVKIGLLVAVIGPLLVVIGSLISAVSAIVGAFSAIPGIVTAVGAVFTGLGGVLSAIGSAFAAIPGIASAVGTAIAAIGGPITILIAAVAALALAWYNNWFGIRDKTAAAWEAIKGAVSAGWEVIKGLVQTGLQGLGEFIRASWESIKNTWSSAWTTIKDVNQQMWNIIKGIIEGGIGAVKGILESGWSAIKGAATSAWEGIKGAVQSAIEGMRNGVQSALEGIRNAFSNVWNSIKSAFDNVWSGIKSAFTLDWGSIGRGIIDGIVNGIRSAWNAVVDAATYVAQGALDAAKRALGIASPSRVAMEQVGIPFGEGIKAGLQRAMSGVSANVTAQLNAMVGGIQPTAALQGSGGVTVEISQIFNGTVDRQAVAGGSRDGVLAALRQVGLR